MYNQEHVIAVKKALDLSILISKTKDSLSELKSEKFKDEPTAPVRQIFSPNYPEIKSTVEFWSIKLLPTILFLPWIVIYYFIYKKEKEADIERIRNSSEYRNKCAIIDKEIKQKQEIADKEFKQKLEEYNNTVLAEYKKDLAEWTKQHNQKISDKENILESATKELSEHYLENRIIPTQYREIEILQYIYDMISTSDYSIKEAIDMYDKERQRRLEDERIYQQQQANALAMEQNDLLIQQNAINERARRNARNAAIVGAVQRHNTNKILKNKLKR